MADTGSGKPIGQLVAQIAAVASPEQSTRALNGSNSAHKRKFLEVFRRWEMLFKRKDGGSVEAEKWLIAEYYDSLRHLSADGFDTLTAQLKEKCIFFPTIRECLELTKPAGPFDYAHPFFREPRLFVQPAKALPAPVHAIEAA